MWWLILCVNLTGPQIPRYLAKYYSWEWKGVYGWESHLNWWTQKSWSPFSVWVSIIQSAGSTNQTKRWRKEEFTFCLPVDLGHWSSRALRFEPELTPSVPPSSWAFTFGLGLPHRLSWVSNLQMPGCGTFQTHNHMSRFLILCIYGSISLVQTVTILF